MTIQCMAADPDLGVALRLAGFLDCQARALGENGFQALTGAPVMTAILTGLVTIFIALIGYRMILGAIPGVRDGIGWALRLGIVLALVTSWPAFQTLVYRVVTDGPQELTAVILPAMGLSPDSMDDRIQAAYDQIRLGSFDAGTALQKMVNSQRSAALAGTMVNPPPAPPSPQSYGTPPLPQTASLFVISTAGLTAALRIAVGFLVAIGPLAILGLLFQGTVSLFEGWLRALIGTALGVLAVSVTTAIELVAIESQIAHEQSMQIADTASALDPQALVTIILFFGVVALAAVYAALRVASAFRLPAAGTITWSSQNEPAFRRSRTAEDTGQRARPVNGSGAVEALARTRAGAVADALTAAAYRDQELRIGNIIGEGYARPMTVRQESGGIAAVPAIPLGVAGRRSTGRRTQSARRRDMSA